MEEDEQHTEGPYWLMRLAVAITVADKEYVYAGMKHFRSAACAHTDTQMKHVYTNTSSPLKLLLLVYVPLSLSGERIEEGFLVEKGEWLQFVWGGARIYKTLRGERFLNTNALARITKATLVRLLRGELQVSAAEHDRIFNSASER